jgi:hypothetical protein
MTPTGYGAYYETVQRYTYSITRDTGSNQKVATYTAGAIYFCWVKETSASEETDGGQKEHITNAEIHINQLPPLDARDRLVDQRTGYVYQIAGIVHDFTAYELIVSAYRLPSMEALS